MIPTTLKQLKPLTKMPASFKHPQNPSPVGYRPRSDRAPRSLPAKNFLSHFTHTVAHSFKTIFPVSRGCDSRAAALIGDRSLKQTPEPQPSTSNGLLCPR